MKTRKALKRCRFEVFKRGAQPRKRRARVVYRVILRGELRVQPQPALGTRIERFFAEPPPLIERIEYDVAADARELVHIRLFVGRRIHMRLAAEQLRAKLGFKKAARRRAAKIPADQRIQAVHRKRLLREQYFAAAARHHIGKQLQILDEPCFVHHIARRGQLIKPVLHQSTKTGLKSSCHGRPHLLSASINGSGSNSSTLNTPAPRHVPFISSIAPIIAGTPVV